MSRGTPDFLSHDTGRWSLHLPKASQQLSEKLITQEKEMIEAALTESRGRVSGPAGAAAKLGIIAFDSGIEYPITQDQQASLQARLATSISSLRKSGLFFHELSLILEDSRLCYVYRQSIFNDLRLACALHKLA